MQALYERADGGVPVPALHNANGIRIAEIEGLMADAKGEYWHSEELQNEYRARLETEDAGGPEGMLDEVGGRMDAALGSALEGVTAAFDGLDDSLKLSIGREMAQPAGPADPATTEDLAAFAQTSHGDLLLSRWGADGAQRLGGLMARVERFEASLSDTDFANWQDFFHQRLTALERFAILNGLVA